MAMMSAERAADILNKILSKPSQQARLLRDYARRVNAVMDMYLKFVSAWYSGKEFVEVFLNPTDLLQIAPAVNAVLAGNEARSFAIKWRIWLFYFFVRMQRRWPLSPRLTLVPLRPSDAAPDMATAVF